ncbi:MAG: hypothetical protein AAF962_06280 [Actinomycetota bacterium]
MTTNVLFLCPHSAGKSLAAATYLRSAAARAGIDVDIAVAGTDPDAVNMPTVVDALSAQGFRIDWQPRLVTEADTAAADHVVSIGCDHDAVPTTSPIVEWDVPLISIDLLGSLDAIHHRCEELATRLAEQAPDSP